MKTSTVIQDVQNRKFGVIVFLFIISLLFYGNIFADNLKVLHEKTFDVQPGQRLNVEASVADIKITTWDKNEFYIKVLGNDRAEDKIRFIFEKTDYGVYVKAEKEGGSFFNWFGFSNIKLRFEIKLPSNFDTDLKTSGGDISIVSLSGESHLRTSGGDITLMGTNGLLDGSTSGGSTNSVNVMTDRTARP